MTQNPETIKENNDKFKYKKAKIPTLKDPINKVKRQTSFWRKGSQYI